ncbi:MAG TPA: tetratricopeptide repeat protein [Rickettsiales bacterium]|nr:tetratricopeptide repeat protein [Rickettsiales bacterium]
MKKFYFLFIFLFVSFNSYSTEKDSSLDVVEQVEKNLIYSKEVLKPEQADVIIKKGGWTEQDTKKLENTNVESAKKINATITKSKDDIRDLALKRKAFDAINAGQYEIAVKLYKEVLRSNKKDVYAKLGLATAYQYLNQYIQAKPLYIDVLEVFPTDQQVMANLLAIISNETPYEAIYLLSSIADKNLTSPLIQAQTSIAYSRVKNYARAIEYIQRAIDLDSKNLEYQYNLAVLYDLSKDYDKAKSLYKDLLTSSNIDNFNLPIKDIKDRIEILETQ